jgi:hypothetical protein
MAIPVGMQTQWGTLTGTTLPMMANSGSIVRETPGLNQWSLPKETRVASITKEMWETPLILLKTLWGNLIKAQMELHGMRMLITLQVGLLIQLVSVSTTTPQNLVTTVATLLGTPGLIP